MGTSLRSEPLPVRMSYPYIFRYQHVYEILSYGSGSQHPCHSAKVSSISPGIWDLQYTTALGAVEMRSPGLKSSEYQNNRYIQVIKGKVNCYN